MSGDLDGIWRADTGGDGVPVVLVHGDWTDSRVWSGLTPLLTGRHRVIRYDLRGFGRSARPAAPYVRLDDLRAILDDLDVPEAIVAGHSGGGGTALGLALAAPERVSALVLVAPGVHDYPWPLDDPYFQRAGSLIEAGDQDGLLNLGLATWAPGAADDDVTAQFRSAISSWFAIGDLEQADPPAYGRLRELAIPAVMVLGDLEYPMMTDISQAIAARIDGCQTIVVDGADHLLPLRTPAVLADIIATVTGLASWVIDVSRPAHERIVASRPRGRRRSRPRRSRRRRGSSPA